MSPRRGPKRDPKRHTARNGSRPPGSPELPSESESFGKIASVLSRTIAQGTVWPHLEQLLAYVQGVAGADACELFLEEVGGGDLLLMACTGPGRDALLERVRFQPGVGFPGLVQATHASILTHDLATDDRFLRPRVIREGFHSYVCVPLFGPGARPAGSLHLAWRNSDADLERAAALLESISPLLGTALWAECSSARMEAESRLVRLSRQGGSARSRDILRFVQAKAGAQHGTILVFDPETGRRRATISNSRSAIPCLAKEDRPWQCSAMRDQHGVMRTRLLPSERFGCPPLADSVCAQCCLPMVDQGKVVGAVLLEYSGDRPRPDLSELPQLLAAVRGLGRFVPTTGSEPPPTADDDAAARSGGANGSAVPPAAPVRAAGVSSPPSEPPPRLALSCFGPFEVRLEGAVIGRNAFGRKLAIDLLKILALRAGQPVSSFALEEWLWPDSDEDSAANRLHGIVHTLRNVIEPDRTRRSSSVLLNESGHYRLIVGPDLRIDLLDFRAEIAAARRWRQQGRIDEACESFEAAVALYRGDLFEDDPYAEWCRGEGLELQHDHLEALGFLASAMLERSEYERAAGYLRRALRWEPLREDLHRQLVSALLALGQRREAREQYRECLWMLKSELQAEPLPETRELEEALRGA